MTKVRCAFCELADVTDPNVAFMIGVSHGATDPGFAWGRHTCERHVKTFFQSVENADAHLEALQQKTSYSQTGNE